MEIILYSDLKSTFFLCFRLVVNRKCVAVFFLFRCFSPLYWENEAFRSFLCSPQSIFHSLSAFHFASQSHAFLLVLRRYILLYEVRKNSITSYKNAHCMYNACNEIKFIRRKLMGNGMSMSQATKQTSQRVSVLCR